LTALAGTSAFGGGRVLTGSEPFETGDLLIVDGRHQVGINEEGSGTAGMDDNGTSPVMRWRAGSPR
jgi:hypothetical protein